MALDGERGELTVRARMVVDAGGRAAPLALAFHADADLPAARSAQDAAALVVRARGVPGLGALLAGVEFVCDGDGGFTAAYGSALDPVAGSGWCAVGDAALCFDPLSSQGLLNALFTGLAAAEAAHRALDKDACAMPG